MPIFEYLCKSCGHKFEQIVYGTNTPDCPSCQASGVEKQISGFAVGSTGVPSSTGGPCGSCGDPRGPGACSMN
ncbi:MAG: FmdB family zinc ribbon protein [Nitrospirales bacterium]